MKTRGWVIFGIILIIVGGCCCASALSQVDFDYKKLQLSEGYEEKTETFDFVENLSVNITIGELEVITHTGDSILVEYSQDDHNKYVVTETNNTLTIKYENEYAFPWSWFNFNNFYVKVSLPQQIMNNVTLKATTGEIDIRNIDVKTLKIKATTGSVDLNNVNADDVDLSCTTGSIVIKNSTINHLLDISATTGEVKLNNVICTKITGNCTTGDIKAEDLTCPYIDFNVTTGSIKLNLIGQKSDYKITVHTTLGDSNISSTSSGDKTLILKTTTGDIKVYFK